MMFSMLLDALFLTLLGHVVTFLFVLSWRLESQDELYRKAGTDVAGTRGIERKAKYDAFSMIITIPWPYNKRGGTRHADTNSKRTEYIELSRNCRIFSASPASE